MVTDEIAEATLEETSGSGETRTARAAILIPDRMQAID